MTNLQLVNLGYGRRVGPHVDGVPRLKAEGCAEGFDRAEKRNGFVLEHAPIVKELTFDVNTFTFVGGKLPYMTLGKRIKELRKDRKIGTQADLAKLVGCKREAVTMWETDKVKAVGGDYLTALAKALRTTPDYIQKGKGPRDVGSAEERLTEEDSEEPATQALINIRNANNFHALRIFLGTIAAVTYSMRPNEGAAVLAAIRAQEGIEKFVNRGLGKSLVRAIERAVKSAEEQPSSQRSSKQ